MVHKGGLGKGLEALIPGAQIPSQTSGVSFISATLIAPNPHQPRHHLDDDKLKELADSIREHGIIQPLIVTQDNQNDQYILIAGERRLRAAQLAGLAMVPVIIRQATEQDFLELALVENVQRADLTPLETAEAYRQLNQDFNLSHEDIASRVGKDRTTISNTLRLLKLPEPVQAALAELKISEGHARALLGLNSIQAQLAALDTIIKEKMTVRQTEELVQKYMGDKPARKTPQLKSPEIRSIEERLRTGLNTKVNLRHGKKGGSLTIFYFSDEELNTIISQILKE